MDGEKEELLVNGIYVWRYITNALRRRLAGGGRIIPFFGRRRDMETRREGWIYIIIPWQ